MNEKRQILKHLSRLGIRVKNGRVAKADVERIFGSELVEELEEPTEWLVTNDLGFEISDHYQRLIEADFASHGRMANPATYKICRFRSDKPRVDGVIYQYSFKFNPRNIKYAYKLFAEGNIVSQNAGIRSSLEAEAACDKAAKSYLQRSS